MAQYSRAQHFFRNFQVVGPGPSGGHQKCKASNEFEWIMCEQKTVLGTGKHPAECLTKILRRFAMQ